MDFCECNDFQKRCFQMNIFRTIRIHYWPKYIFAILPPLKLIFSRLFQEKRNSTLIFISLSPSLSLLQRKHCSLVLFELWSSLQIFHKNVKGLIPFAKSIIMRLVVFNLLFLWIPFIFIWNVPRNLLLLIQHQKSYPKITASISSYYFYDHPNETTPIILRIAFLL